MSAAVIVRKGEEMAAFAVGAQVRAGSEYQSQAFCFLSGLDQRGVFVNEVIS